jgi:hypothetical protein
MATPKVDQLSARSWTGTKFVPIITQLAEGARIAATPYESRERVQATDLGTRARSEWTKGWDADVLDTGSAFDLYHTRTARAV